MVGNMALISCKNTSIDCIVNASEIGKKSFCMFTKNEQTKISIVDIVLYTLFWLVCLRQVRDIINTYIKKPPKTNVINSRL